LDFKGVKMNKRLIYMLVIMIISLSLLGCMSQWVIKNYGGGYKEIKGDSVYLYGDKILIGGDVFVDNKKLGRGFGVYSQNDWEDREPFKTEVYDIQEGEMPIGATKVQEGGDDKKTHYSYDIKNAQYRIFYFEPALHVNPQTKEIIARSVIPQKDGFVASRKWYRWIDTGLMLFVTAPLDAVITTIVLYGKAHGG
jgi:hypothetical protein